MMFTKETIKDGHKMVDGVFRAISKNKVPNPSKDLPIKYYYSTNKGQKYITSAMIMFMILNVGYSSVG